MAGFKSIFITGALGLVVALGLAYLWKSEQVKSARIEGELAQALTNTETLKAVVKEQGSAFSEMAKLARQNQELMDELSRQRDDARAETAKMRSEIDLLRSSEASRALAAPFRRGDLARERFTHSLRRIADQKGGADPGGDHPDSSETGDRP